MKDEIKEILDKAKEISDYGADGKQHTRMFNQFEAKALLDYITNLQEENEILRKNAEHNDKVVDKARWNEMIYKSRNEKAIEYIKECTSENDEDYIFCMELLNILQGGDKE